MNFLFVSFSSLKSFLSQYNKKAPPHRVRRTRGITVSCTRHTGLCFSRNTNWCWRMGGHSPRWIHHGVTSYEKCLWVRPHKSPCDYVSNSALRLAISEFTVISPSPGKPLHSLKNQSMTEFQKCPSHFVSLMPYPFWLPIFFHVVIRVATTAV